jgi:Cu(I)/Ag(I) efflux system membrane fusion protein
LQKGITIMTWRILSLLGLTGALLGAGAFFYSTEISRLVAGDAYRFEAVTAQVSAERGQEFAIRINGPDGTPAENAKITGIRLDMSPDGMAGMNSPVTEEPPGAPGIFAYRADFTMAGRWALHVEAQVPGLVVPVIGEIILTAVDPAKKSQNGGGSRRIAYYRNPMGLPDTSPIPKKDPMGMEYIAVYEDEVSGPAGTVRISLDKVQRSGVRTETVTHRAMGSSVRVSGIVEHDESRVTAATARFNGFIDELYVSVTGHKVAAGEPLAKIWIESPEILQKQVDYLIAVKASGGESSADVQRAQRTLTLFGFPEDAIEDLRKTGRAVRSFTMRAPADGTVIEKAAMRGMRFQSGEMLYKLIDLSEIWVVANVPEREIGRVAEGQTAQITFNAFPGEEFEGKVLLVHPELDMATRTAMVRIGLPNRGGRLKSHLFAEVEIETGAGGRGVIAIPQSAVIDSGERQVVIVEREEGLYEPRDVKLGHSRGGLTEIVSGLEAGERIVTAGNFLIDSESNLRASLNGLNSGAAQQ